jgi:hypothetical protein
MMEKAVDRAVAASRAALAATADGIERRGTPMTTAPRRAQNSRSKSRIASAISAVIFAWDVFSDDKQMA